MKIYVNINDTVYKQKAKKIVQTYKYKVFESIGYRKKKYIYITNLYYVDVRNIILVKF